MTQNNSKKPTPRLFKEVSFLPINEIAELWAPELGLSRSIVVQELRLGLINLPRLRKGKPLLKKCPPDADLPPATEPFYRRDIIDFCNKQAGWPKPQFWFPR